LNLFWRVKVAKECKRQLFRNPSRPPPALSENRNQTTEKREQRREEKRERRDRREREREREGKRQREKEREREKM